MGHTSSEAELSFEAVYAEHEAFVRRELARRGVRPADLDDVLQETFVTVHRLLSTFEGRASLETWLHAVTWRVASGYHRRRRSERGLSAVPESSSAELSPFELPGAEHLYDSLERMHPGDRDLLLLNEVGGLSISEIAEITGSARATVSAHLDRAIKTLGRHISVLPPASSAAISGASFIDASDAQTAGARSLTYEHPGCYVSSFDDLVIAVWQGYAPNECLDRVTDVLVTVADEHPAGVVFLSVIGPTSPPPDRSGREAIGRAATRMKGKLRAAAWATGTRGFSYLVPPIINAYAFFARSPLNIRFFHEVPAAAAWLAPQTERTTAQSIISHTQAMKAQAKWPPGT